MPYFLLYSTLIFIHSIHTQDSLLLNYSILEEIQTDIDGDGQEETLRLLEYGNEEDGLERQIRLYQNFSDTSVLWKVYDSAILSSHDGGVMGDPFEGISVQDSSLSIVHYGGSSWSWSLIDDYVFRNGEYVLIHHTSTFGKYCEEMSQFSINLDSGRAHYKNKQERCEGDDPERPIYPDEIEDFIQQGLKVLMKNRFDTNRIITSPVYGYKMDL